MSTSEKTNALERLVEIIGAAQFTNGSLDVTLQGPETGFGSPLRAIVSLEGEALESLSTALCGIATAVSVALSDVATALLQVASAIREARGRE